MSFLNKVSLKGRLFLGFGSLILLMLIANSISYSLVVKGSDIAQEVKNDDVPGAILYMHLLDEVSDMQTNVMEYLIGESEAIDIFEGNYKEFQTALAQLIPLESAKESDRVKMRKIESLTSHYYNTAKQDIFALYDPVKHDAALKLQKEIETGIGAKLYNLLFQLQEEEYQDAQNTTDINETLNDDIPGIRLYMELVDETEDMMSDMFKYASGNFEYKGEFERNKKQFIEYLAQVRELEKKPQEVANLNAIESMFNEMTTKADQMFKTYDSSSLKKATKIAKKLQKDTFVELEQILDVSVKEETTDATSALTLLTADLSSLMNTFFALTAAAIFIGLSIAFFISRSITSRTEQLLKVTRLIALGDLTSEDINDKSADELKQLAVAVNDMSGSLNEMIHRISGITQTVSSSVGQLQGLNSELVATATKQAEQAAYIATAVEEMSSTVADVAKQSQGAATKAEAAGDAARKGGEVVKDTIKGVADAAQIVSETAETINELGNKSAQIGDVINVINSIAEQTNLLALNAAIEAARAGEFGRGFSVVADEVRSLAERTTIATREVSASIKGIQADTQTAVERMKLSTVQVQKSVSLAEHAGNSLNIIMKEAEEITHAIHSIAAATEQQAAVASEMAANITEISDGANYSRQNSEQAAKATTDVNNQSQQLLNIVANFKLKK